MKGKDAHLLHAAALVNGLLQRRQVLALLLLHSRVG